MKSMKESTRLVIHKQFGVLNSFSIVVSSGIAAPDKVTSRRMEVSDYLQVGRDIVNSLEDLTKHEEMFETVSTSIDLSKSKGK